LKIGINKIVSKFPGMKRVGMKEKLTSFEEAARLVKDGYLLGLTSPSENAPMAFLRELVRLGRKNLRVATLTGGSLNVDLLIGAGAVAEYETCACSLGGYGQAPNFQRALRSGGFKMKDST
jgi:glutaconate CoA-transferase subunit A